MNGTARTPSRLFISIPGVPLLGTGPTSGTLGDTATDLWQSGAKFCHFRLFGCLQHSFAHRHLPQAPSPPPASALPSPAALCPAPRPQRVTPPAGTAFGVLHLCDPGPGPCSRPSGLARPSPTSLSSLKPTSSCHTHGVHRSIASTTGGLATTWACCCALRPPAWASGHTHSVTSAKGAGCTPRLLLRAAEGWAAGGWAARGRSRLPV